MAEKIDLGSPAQAKPGTVSWRPFLININWDAETIKIGFRGDNEEYTSIAYEGATAIALMAALNKADLGVKSLHRRIMERVISDGLLSGTISGTPD